MRMKQAAALAASVLLAGTLALAGGRPQATPQGRARLRQNISTLMLVRMTQALDLTQEQAADLFPVLTRIEKDKADLQRRLGMDVRKLRAALQNGETKESSLLDLVARVGETRRAIRQKDEEFDAALDTSLTPVQKAKYVIFTVDFYRGLGETAARARARMAGRKVERRP